MVFRTFIKYIFLLFGVVMAGNEVKKDSFAAVAGIVMCAIGSALADAGVRAADETPARLQRNPRPEAV